jgi:hypothetical protein
MGLEDIGLVGGTKGSPKKRITQEADRVHIDEEDQRERGWQE